MKGKKSTQLTMDQLISNAKKVLKGRLSTGNNTAFETAIKKAVQAKQRGSK